MSTSDPSGAGAGQLPELIIKVRPALQLPRRDDEGHPPKREAGEASVKCRVPREAGLIRVKQIKCVKPNEGFTYAFVSIFGC